MSEPGADETLRPLLGRTGLSEWLAAVSRVEGGAADSLLRHRHRTPTPSAGARRCPEPAGSGHRA
ncbi:hypothetical protein [Streptomyces scabiei]|uniref:hypothetical protein n=1 Tax=Streptomyces scabiei TaxID=1930 RepID=UPI0029B4B0FE|nr:hypothetical protein [Streptomyces scabiei]MDX3517403.1 hypothetical protein [Streptomyces scabiei]